MRKSWRGFLAALVVAGLVNLGGVSLFFEPIAKSDTAGGPIIPRAVGFFVYVVLTVLLFDWTARQMRNAYKAAFVVAAAQFLLVNVDFVLAGKRGVVTGAASTVLIAITWSCVAFAYSFFVRWEND